MWDDIAKTYPLRTGRESVVKALDLIEDRLPRKISAIDLGCGPGTHAIPFSYRFETVLGVDSSGEMLQRLAEECESRNISNVRVEKGDCMARRTDGKYDLAFTCLCPGMYSEDALRTLDALSAGLCIYIGPSYSAQSTERGVLSKLGLSMGDVFDTHQIVGALPESKDVWTAVFEEGHNFTARENLIRRCTRLLADPEADGQALKEYINGLDEGALPANRELMVISWIP